MMKVRAVSAAKSVQPSSMESEVIKELARDLHAGAQGIMSGDTPTRISQRNTHAMR